MSELLETGIDFSDFDTDLGTYLPPIKVRGFTPQNAFDVILDDIRDVADASTLKEIESGLFEVVTVRDYCVHMEKSYMKNWKEVDQLLWPMSKLKTGTFVSRVIFKIKKCFR